MGIIYDRQYEGYKVKTTVNGKDTRVALGKSPKLDIIPPHILALAAPFLGTKGIQNATKTPQMGVENGTLRQFIDFYLESRQHEWADDTRKLAVISINQFLSFCGKNKIKELDVVNSELILMWVNLLAKKIKPVSIRTRLVIISGVFSSAVKLKKLTENPVKYPLTRVNGMVRKYKQMHPSKHKSLTPEQQKRYWAAFETAVATGKRSQDVQDIAIVCGYSGLRIKAAVNLTFENCISNIIDVPTDIDKGKVGQRLIMMDQAVAVIERRRAQLGTGRVFPNIKRPKSVYRYLETFVRQSKLDDILALGHYCHILRHSFAMNLYRAAVPVPVISKQLGHKNIKTTMMYLDINDDIHLETMSKIKMD